MSSLVSDFIINPVARTVRRFSSPFATAVDADPVRHLSREFELDNGDAIAECDGPSISFPGISFLRSPDVALGARAPPLLTPLRRHIVPPTEDDPILGAPTERSSSPPIFEMEHPDTVEDDVPQPAPPTPPQEALSSAVDTTRTAHKLPENDGMMEMRRKIQTIQSSSVTIDQKRHLMQQVLTENYALAKHATAVREGKIGADVPRAEYPSVSTPRDLAFGATALEALKSWTGLDDGKAVVQVSEEDARPTFVPKCSPADCDYAEHADEEEGEEEDTSEPELGCAHYKRNVRIQCAECQKWYTCRLCHDAVEEHILPRKLTRHMLCMLCGHPQKASDTCVKCGENAASYYCNICKLWSDDVNKHIYHCDECGICRVGRGLEKDFFHCKTCRACISISTRDDHKCIERATDADCPICGENMFSSPQTVIFMECGHPIHKTCFNLYMEVSYRCPLCHKSITKMDALFLNLANIIKEQPMPQEFQDVRSVIFCNDCSAKCSTPYHFLGLRCQICQSFNTMELDRSPMPGERTEAEQHAAQAGPSQPSSPRRPSELTPGGLDNPLTSPALHSPCSHFLPSRNVMQSNGSPSRHPHFAEPEINLEDEDEDEELNFWGGAVRSGSSADETGTDSESADDLDDSDNDDEGEDEEEGDDEDDDNDDGDIILLGHR